MEADHRRTRPPAAAVAVAGGAVVVGVEAGADHHAAAVVRDAAGTPGLGSRRRHIRPAAAEQALRPGD